MKNLHRLEATISTFLNTVRYALSDIKFAIQDFERDIADMVENENLRLSKTTKTKSQSRFPLQPIERKDGELRFRENRIVRFLLDNSIFDLNTLATMGFPNEDWEQFAQLTGYSVSGFGELSYVSDETFELVNQKVATFDVEGEPELLSLDEIAKEVADNLNEAIRNSLFRLATRVSKESCLQSENKATN